MNGSGLKRVLGVTGDRLRVSDSPMPTATNPGHTEELALYVNGGGIILALTPEQVNQRLSIGSKESPAHPPDLPRPKAKPAPQTPGDSTLGGYQQA